jgi:hypothetical protein
MRTTNLFVLVITLIPAWLLPSCAAAGPTPTATAAEPARITVLYDAFGKDATMTATVSMLSSCQAAICRRPLSS